MAGSGSAIRERSRKARRASSRRRRDTMHPLIMRRGITLRVPTHRVQPQRPRRAAAEAVVEVAAVILREAAAIPRVVAEVITAKQVSFEQKESISFFP
jgi:hypothetical protein